MPDPQRKPRRRRTKAGKAGKAAAAGKASTRPPAMTPAAIDQAVLLLTRNLRPSATITGAAAILEREGSDPAAAGRLVAEAKKLILASASIDFEYEAGLRLVRNDELYALAIAANDLKEARQLVKARGEILREAAADFGAGRVGADAAMEADLAADALRRAGLGTEQDNLAELVRLAIARLIEADALTDPLPDGPTGPTPQL